MMVLGLADGQQQVVGAVDGWRLSAVVWEGEDEMQEQVAEVRQVDEKLWAAAAWVRDLEVRRLVSVVVESSAVWLSWGSK